MSSNRVFENSVVQLLKTNKLAGYWFKNGIMSLALAGIYSVILVLLRTPILVNLFSNTDIFRSALVIHVNLSILIWLISIIVCIWSYKLPLSIYSLTCTVLASIGTILIALTPLFGETVPVMNNYIPMLENITFILGMSLFGISVLLFSIFVLYQSLINWRHDRAHGNELISFTVFSTSVIFILVWVCFVCSHWQLQKIVAIIPIDIELYYELLFWSGGHLLQFLYTQILMFVWIILCQAWLNKELRFKKLYLWMLYLNFSISTVAILGHLLFDIIDGEFTVFYTQQMQYGGGIAPVIVLAIMLYELLTQQEKAVGSYAAKTSLLCSIGLFLSGGFFGILISGMNVSIPAHYHGSIVGISVALMGFGFVLCNNQQEEKNNYFSVAMITLTVGQMLHTIALLFAGGYGVLRKTPGVEISISAKILMGIMGGGGLIAIVGGLMFVIICARKILFTDGTNI